MPSTRTYQCFSQGHISVTLMQGTLQQRYAAAALQKLNWYYLPQTKRWYKPINTGTTVDNFGRVGACCPFRCLCGSTLTFCVG